jgi:hypothetical protein
MIKYKYLHHRRTTYMSGGITRIEAYGIAINSETSGKAGGMSCEPLKAVLKP